MPGAISFFTEDDDFVLPFIQIEAEARFEVTVARPIVSAGDVIYVDQNAATLGMGEVDEFRHCGLPLKEYGTRVNELASSACN